MFFFTLAAASSQCTGQPIYGLCSSQNLLIPPGLSSTPDEATNFFHAVIYIYRTKGASWLEDGLRLTPVWSVLSPAHVLVLGSLSDPLYPGMGMAPRSCLDHGIHLCLEDSRCWPSYINDKKRILHHLRLVPMLVVIAAAVGLMH